MKHVLFVTYGGGHVNVVLPLIEALQSRGDVRISVLGLTAARTKIEAAGIPCLGFRDFLEPGDGMALAHGKRLAAALPPSVVPADESIAYLGLSYAELEAQSEPGIAEQRYRAKGRAAFLPVGVLERVLDRLEPDLVVATNSPRAEQAAILSAGKKAIPSVCVVDTFGLNEMAWLSQPGYADRICVLAEFVRDILVKHGRPSDEIAVTGNPDFDRLADPSLSARAEELRRALGWHNKQVVLWCSEWSGESDIPTKLAIDDALIAAARSRPTWAMAVRFHPNEPSRADRFPRDWTVSTQADDLGVLLSAVDLVVVFSSTVGLQAALLGKRVVTYRATSVADSARYDEFGIAKACWSIADLPATIDQALADPDARPPRFATLGDATKNVLKVIDSLLG